MPVLLKIDGSTVKPLEYGQLRVETKIRKGDQDIEPGSAVFIWSHYSQPRIQDGQLIALGVVTRADRSPDKALVDLTVALSSCPPTTDWRTAELDQLKNRNDGSPETEIANEVRGYTHDHVGHVSGVAAALMAKHFI